MSLLVNGQSRVPPGFRFHPTEEELLHYYLRKKVAFEKIDLDVIRDVDLNKLEPWDIQEKCQIGSTPQNDWYFFSHKDKKYPTGTRTNRATAAGFWKATGRDKVIYTSYKRIGMRKTLVFYKGRAPHGQKSDWIMHEYRLDDNTDSTNSHSFTSSSSGETAQEEGWVVCRVFKKKNHHKTLESPKESAITGESSASFLHSSNDGALDQILQYIGRTCKQETEANNTNMRFLRPLEMNNIAGFHERFTQLPNLESPTLPGLFDRRTCYSPIEVQQQQQQQQQVITDIEASSANHDCANSYSEPPNISDWGTLERLVASLNGQEETTKQLVCFNDPTLALTTSQPFPSFCNASDQELQLPQVRSTNRLLLNNNQDYDNDIDLWSFARSSSSSDPLTSSPHTTNSGFVSTTSV